MGLFDRFKKKEKGLKINNIINENEKSYEIEYGTTRDGRLQVDFYDKSAKVGQLYDTTRLVVDNRPLILANQEVRNCIVSWYSQDDAIFADPEYEGESLNARDYRGILAQIDPMLLQTDENYCSVVMRKLLDQKRVIKYLEDGLQETPEQPCGKYIGGVKPTEKGYGKFFSLSVGRASHNSDLMINRRREYRESIEAKKQSGIANKKAQIQQLQSEIDDMSK